MAGRIVVVGVSKGGLRALEVLLGALPADFPWPVVICQHRAPDRSAPLEELLRRYTRLKVVEAEDKMEIAPGRVYLAPPDYHLLVERDGCLSLSVEAPISWARPSVDVLFESAADAFGAAVIAVILTGANNDGAAGAAAVKARGGMVIVQNPETAESPAMPQAAIAVPIPEIILPLDEIGPYLLKKVGGVLQIM
jgi:two-component system chemotaxis response regulator CheB